MLVGLVVVVVLTRILVGLWHSAEALQWMAKVREMEVELDKAGKTHDASLSSVQEELHKHKRHTFSKVLWIVPLHSKCTRALTFENVCRHTEQNQAEREAERAKWGLILDRLRLQLASVWNLPPPVPCARAPSPPLGGARASGMMVLDSFLPFACPCGLQR
jgi:hypothetical protein